VFVMRARRWVCGLMAFVHAFVDEVTFWFSRSPSIVMCTNCGAWRWEGEARSEGWLRFGSPLGASPIWRCDDCSLVGEP